ncbi:SAM-dependent methyltransferase [Thermocatellispora tengchongensis]|uniref:SAM-dependent methyltransferase n=1 Tax=Thermocatellispora tengchongensis TaxID=1073253 RepID=A0A840PBG3_9ACTN|nr:class I SAM-dependent methyltransferase [Thermocatellispora tengchongensis]MBB5136026.1 SAM-dependent methyltransferase [Thermocatellispora tengchongensis]
MYGADTAAIYDQQHRARGKDYEGEARYVAEQILARFPGARSLLDVACGTGGHYEPFRAYFGTIEGVDLSEPMLRIARAAHPGAVFHRGDMRDFDLGRTFDAVTCLFASIAYVASQAELRRALERFAAHVVPGGVVAVEPWWFPETFLDDSVSRAIVEGEGRTIARVTHTVRDGDASRMEAHYLVAEPGVGVRHFTETHRAMLFTREQYEDAFVRAGLKPEYLAGTQSGRGLFVGVREAL